MSVSETYHSEGMLPTGSRAMICAEDDCGTIFREGDCCPKCKSRSVMNLSALITPKVREGDDAPHPHPHLCLCRFSPDERELILWGAKRVDDAREVYGHLILDTDARDHEVDALEEDLDARFYLSKRLVQRVRASRLHIQRGKTDA